MRFKTRRARDAVIARAIVASRAAVHRASDQRIEQVLGRRVALRALFGALASALSRKRNAGVVGELTFELRAADGRVRTWTVSATAGGARAWPGRADAPDLVVKLGLADLARIAVGELDAGTALLTRRLDVEGDALLATRLADALG